MSKVIGQKFQNLGFPGHRYILTLILSQIRNGEALHLYFKGLYLSSTFSSYHAYLKKCPKFGKGTLQTVLVER